jgi:dienelactone hydrolase
MVLKLILFAAAFGLPAFAATAGESVDYVVDGETFEGYWSAAKGDSKGLVVIVHDWSGTDGYEKKRADMLAELGYDAFALDLYGKGNRPADLADRKREAGKLLADRARMRKLLLAGLDQARRGSDRPAVVIGYCFGGAAALELARSGQANNVVGYATFHGGLTTPEGQSYPSTTPPILVAHGGADTSVTMDDVAALSRQLEQAGVPYEIQVYSGAPHGFTNFEAQERYQKRADERSWSAFTNFLTEIFGG